MRTNNAYIISDYIKVVPGTTYYFDGCVPSASSVKSAFYAESKSLIPNSVGGMVSETAPANAKYLRVTVLATNRYKSAQVRTVSGASYEPFTDKNCAVFNILAQSYDAKATYPKNTIVSENGLFYKSNKAITTAGDFNPTDWDLVRSLANGVLSANDSIMFGENSITGSGSNVEANTQVNLLGVTNIAKNVIYQFCGTFSEFSKLTIGQGAQTTVYASWITIDATTLTIYRRGSNSNHVETFTHGLSINDFINVQILTKDNYRCIVKIQTKETTDHVDAFEVDTTDMTQYPVATFIGNCVGQYYFVSETDIIDYTYTVIFKDATKPIYLFGDSYMSFAPERWVYYLSDIDCFNSVLINACSGENSSGASQALATLKGHPKFALWGLGMNDSADANSSTPASNWLSGFNSFLSWCNSNGCTPIFATIPTIPDKLHEGKNNYIRSSGYRYVDFAKAVSPSGDGIWYPGMINETDYTHPTEKGAIAMFNRVLADFPEIAGKIT